MDQQDYTPETLPMVWPGSPDVRNTDPETSHHAADVAVKRPTVARAVEKVLAAAGRPMTADAIWTALRTEFGFYCSRERVRTVLNEGAGYARREKDRFAAFVRLEETAPSELGNPAHLWALA